MERFVSGLRHLSSSDGSSVPLDWDNSMMEVAERLSAFADERKVSLTFDARSPIRGKKVVARITPEIASRFGVRHAPVRRRRTARGELIAVDLGKGRVDVEYAKGQRLPCDFNTDSAEMTTAAKRLLGQVVLVSGEEEYDVASQKSGHLAIESLEPASTEAPLAEAFWMNPSAAEQALEQGVQPIGSVSEIARPDLFTDEDIESFIAAIREARGEA
jgi:hypothetical protein